MKQSLLDEMEKLKALVGPDVLRTAACPICEDSGFVYVGRPGDPSPLKRCQCWYQKRKDALLRAARLPEFFSGATFENFDTGFHGAHSSLQLARITAERFLEEYGVAASTDVPAG